MGILFPTSEMIVPRIHESSELVASPWIAMTDSTCLPRRVASWSLRRLLHLQVPRFPCATEADSHRARSPLAIPRARNACLDAAKGAVVVFRRSMTLPKTKMPGFEANLQPPALFRNGAPTTP